MSTGHGHQEDENQLRAGSQAAAGAFLSVREAAERLGVGYQTVYRMVRDGTLPAVRVRGVWRIRHGDLDAFVRRHSGQTSQPEAADRCGACDVPMVSAFSIGGRCVECGTPICVACWRIEQRRHCSEHRPPPAGARPSVAATAKCARCDRAITSLSLAGGRCEHPACDALLCVDCWSEAGRRHCALHQTSADDELAQARASLERGEIPCLVTSIEAKTSEMAFIGRFDRKVRAISTLREPHMGTMVQDIDWAGGHRRWDETEDVIAALNLGFLDRALQARIPLGVHSRYTVPGPRGKVLMVLEAAVISDLAAHVRAGFAASPASLETLVERMDAYAGQAEEAGVPFVIGLAATCGWMPEAVAFVGGGTEGRPAAGGYTHELLLPYLIDLSAAQAGVGTVLYNSADSRSTPYAELFSSRLADEDIAVIIDYVKTAFAAAGGDYLTAVDVSEALRLDPDLVSRAFDRLAAGREYRIDRVRGVGLVVMRS